jgi:hypothetical protein
MTPRSLRKTFLGCKMGKRLLKVFTLLSKKKKKKKRRKKVFTYQKGRKRRYNCKFSIENALRDRRLGKNEVKKNEEK